MIYDRYTSALNTIPLLAPQDTAATALTTPYTKLGGAHGGTLFIQFGNIAAASADQAVTVTLLAATVQAGTSASAIAFNYRLSSAVGDNAWGNITAATASGVSIATTDDNKMLAIEIDPSQILGAKADATYFAATITPDAGGTATLVSAFVQLEPRVSQASMVSAT